jgi:hypothetical protein
MENEEAIEISEKDMNVWWDKKSFWQKSAIIKGGEHLPMPTRSQHYEEFWDDLTYLEKTKIYNEYKA